MKYLFALALVVGCATQSPNAIPPDVEAFLSRTPHENCQQPERLARYANLAECKADVEKKQDQARAVISNYYARQNAYTPAPIQPYYLPPPQQPVMNFQPAPQPAPIFQQPQLRQPVNCTSQMVFGRLQTVCQ